ncbi:hypothetical protein ACOME3_005811 [Neoechinorhynchus agilis]
MYIRLFKTLNDLQVVCISENEFALETHSYFSPVDNEYEEDLVKSVTLGNRNTIDEVCKITSVPSAGELADDDDAEDYYEEDMDEGQTPLTDAQAEEISGSKLMVDSDIGKSRTVSAEDNKRMQSFLKGLMTRPNIMAGLVCASAVIVLALILILIFAIYRIRCRRDEGSYSLAAAASAKSAYGNTLAQQQRSCYHGNAAGPYGPQSGTAPTAYSKVPFTEIYA